MNEWKTYCLEDLIHIKHGYAFKGKFFSEVPTNDIIVTPGNFCIGGGFKTDKLKYYNGDVPKGYILSAGDVILTMTDLSKQADTLGYAAKVPFVKNMRFLHNQRIGLVNVIDPSVEIDFLYWLMRTKNYQKAIAGSATGSTVKHTSPTKIYSFKFRAPKEKKIQNKIASILSAYDNLIENNTRRIKLLEELALRTYEEWFVKFRVSGKQLGVERDSGLPKGWEEKELQFFGKVVTGKTPSTLNENFFNGEVLFVKTPDMAGNVYVLNTSQKLSELGSNSQKTKFIPKDSLMVSCIGSAGAYALASQNCQTNQQINSVVFYKQYYSFYFYCLAQKLKPLLDALGSNGATMTNVNKGKFEKIKVLSPSDDILIEFNEIVQSIFDEILNLQKQIILLKEARDILMPRLMSGKIDLKNAQEELIEVIEKESV